MTKIPILGIVGYSNSGKTTLIERLTAALRRDGLRVAVIKHDAHDFQIDHEGKDSWRFTQAGADVTAVISGSRAVLIENRPLPVEALLDRITDVDLILVEGFKKAAWPKILVCRGEPGEELAAAPEQCVAVVSEKLVEFGVPCFQRDNIGELTALIRSGCWRQTK